MPEGEQPVSDDDDDEENVKPARTTSGGRAASAALTIGMGVWGKAKPSPTGGGASLRRLPARWNLFHRPTARCSLLHRPPLVTAPLEAAPVSTSPPHSGASLRCDSAPERAKNFHLRGRCDQRNNNNNIVLLLQRCRERKRSFLLYWGRGPSKEGRNFP